MYGLTLRYYELDTLTSQAVLPRFIWLHFLIIWNTRYFYLMFFDCVLNGLSFTKINSVTVKEGFRKTDISVFQLGAFLGVDMCIPDAYTDIPRQGMCYLVCVTRKSISQLTINLSHQSQRCN